MLESNKLSLKVLLFKWLDFFWYLLVLAKEVKFFIDSPGDLK